ncbi:MAG: PEP-CTERM sorting domain-containing protein [Thiobacillus sp.]|nr:PEP-CTERM sorting domain-containing protein [Thiobacillus sp.]
MQFFRRHPLLQIIAAFGLGLCANQAGATLISKDYLQGSSDGWITRDTVSKLDWLDVSLTTNQTYDQVRTGTWYQSGFRHATKQEIQNLFLHAGTPDDGFDTSTSHPVAALALAQLLGPTLVVGSYRVSVLGFAGSDFFGNPVTLSSHPLGSNFSALLGKINYLAPGIGEAHFTGGHPFSSEADAIYGSFLVRAVPEPGTLGIMVAGLAMLASRTWRRNALSTHQPS